MTDWTLASPFSIKTFETRNSKLRLACFSNRLIWHPWQLQPDIFYDVGVGFILWQKVEKNEKQGLKARQNCELNSNTFPAFHLFGEICMQKRDRWILINMTQD